MSNCVSNRRGKLMSRAAVISIIAILGAGCSSDFSRLDDPYTAALPTGNQRSIIRKSDIPNQPYPGDVDNLTTASTSNRVKRAARKRVAVSQPYPGDISRKALKPRARQVVRKSVVERAPIGKPVNLAPNLPEGKFETVRTKVASTRKLNDRLPVANRQTNSVTNDASKVGWTAVGGTRVRLRRGENLHNLSRRYGVPVKQIKRVNNISNANNVAAGQSILIPTYTYSRKAAVSAPDNNNKTRASRSSRGYEGEVATSHIATPTPNTRRSARNISSPATRRIAIGGPKVHLVASGDTLGGIAQKYGVNKDAIREANSMSGDVVRLGQKIRIPNQVGAGSSTFASTQKSDPFVTGTASAVPRRANRKFNKNNRPVPYTRPDVSANIARRASEKVATPSQTGVSKFRWPAKGRVVSKFGSKLNGSPNDGIDISVPVGTAVKATENGTVIYAGSELEEFGKLILVRHSGGWVSAYAHSSRNLVSRGDTVRRGQTIARSGRTGTATIPKIHFELRKNSNPVNPLKHLKRS